MVVPFPPGGSIDTVARSIAQHWASQLNQQIVIDNRGGAAGTIGTELVARGARWLHAALRQRGAALDRTESPGQGALRHFQGLRARIAGGDLAVPDLASTALPKNVHELIAYAKARPGQLNYASSGMGQRAASCRRALQQRGRDRHRARAVRDELMNHEDCEAVTSSPEELAKVLREDYAKWGKLIKTIGVKVN
ncbi:MAG TPA: tripartite tricarboxylate transporter substrate-binding protein [Burkholderiales bacterium]|nr:tripartite tricarboxylate transporter substrate-binding protein [Burkholderiales bacterium]